ncbi:hypothetical protein HKX48_009220 [Thoreauomyces humboldtii]|nr:hypothetical protein HKX48_009220 [Thoreauomyces humboldtii]
MSALIQSLVGADACLPAAGMIDLLCRFSCNSISVSDQELVNLGVGVFPNLSLVNHSCSPNAAIVFEGSTPTLRAIREIEAGAEVFQSYMSVAEPRYVRALELKETYFFACACDLCTLHATTADPRTTYRCLRGKCGGIIDLPDRLDEATCSVHGRLDEDEQSKLEETATEAFRLYQKAVQLQDSDPNQALTLAKRCYALQSPMMDVTNASLLGTLTLLLHLYLSPQVKDFKAAHVVSCHLLKAHEGLCEGFHPSVSVAAYTEFKLALAIWDGAAEGRLPLTESGQRAVSLLEKSHGRGHMWKEANAKLQEVGMVLGALRPWNGKSKDEATSCRTETSCELSSFPPVFPSARQDKTPNITVAMRTLEKINRPLILRPPKVQSATSCAVEVATLFNCWRAMAVDAPQCAESAKALTTCMKAQATKKNVSTSVKDINKWLAKATRKKQL